MSKKWTVSVYQDGRRYAPELEIEADSAEEAEEQVKEMEYDLEFGDWDANDLFAEAYQTEEQKNKCPTCGRTDE